MENGTFSREKLAELDEELGKYDVAILKFFCKDLLPKRELQTMNRAVQIFDGLVQKGKISNDKADFLLQCLHHMQKYSLLRKLGYRDIDIGTYIEETNSWEVSPYRVLLFRISEDLGRSEIDTVKYSLQEEYGIKKNQMDRVKSGLDIMDLLEQEGIITPGDTSALENIILQVLQRTDMKPLFEEYQGLTSPQPITTSPPVVKSQTNDRRHGILTSHEARSQNSASQHPVNLAIRSGEAHIHPVDIESRTPDQDNRDSLEVPGAPSAAVVHNPRVIQAQPSSLNLIEHYKMDARPKGVCLIINNENFDDTRLTRRGSDKDAEKLTRTFKKRGFAVRQRDDLKSNDLVVCLSRLAEEDHRRYDALVVCILSHGSEGTVQGTDSRQVQIGDLTAFFKSSSCKSLDGKPKLFFIQACQGDEKKRVTVPRELQSDALEVDVRGVPNATDVGGVPIAVPKNKPTPVIPGEPDFLLGFASVPGFASFRRRSRGSIYIDKLTEAIDSYADSLDLTTLLTMVNREVSREKLEVHQKTTEEGQPANPEPIRYLQVSAPLNALTKRLYL